MLYAIAMGQIPQIIIVSSDLSVKFFFINPSSLFALATALLHCFSHFISLKYTHKSFFSRTLSKFCFIDQILIDYMTLVTCTLASCEYVVITMATG